MAGCIKAMGKVSMSENIDEHRGQGKLNLIYDLP